MCKSNGDHSLLGRRDGAVFGETAHAGERTKKPRTQNEKFPRISEKIPKNNRNKEILNQYKSSFFSVIKNSDYETKTEKNIITLQ